MLFPALLLLSDWTDSVRALPTPPEGSIVPITEIAIADPLDYAPYLSLKRPGVAAFRSFIFPGGGQLYVEQAARGFLLGGLELALLAGAGYSYYSYRRGGFENRGLFTQSLNFTFFFIGAWGYSIVDAYVGAHLYDFSRETEVLTEELHAVGFHADTLVSDTGVGEGGE